MEMNGVKEICVLGFLGINSWIDIRKKQVSLLLIIIFAVCGTVWTIYSRRNVPEVLMCVGDRFSLCADQHPYRRCCGNGRWLAAYGTGDSAVPGRIFFQHFL